jgi:ketosteroid isomerase-like protein
MRKLLIVLIIGAAMAANMAAPSTAMPRKATTPAQVVRASFDALNRGDAAAAAAAFAPNGELITPLGGCNPCTGRAVIQQHLSRAVANGTTVTLVGRPQVKGAVVTFRGEVRASSFPSGIQRVIGVFRSTTRKGLILRQTNDYDRSDPQTAALLAAIQQASGTTSST